MSFTVQEVWERALPSHSAMLELEANSNWVWPEMTPAQVKLLMEAFKDQRNLVAQLGTTHSNSRGLLDNKVAQLENLTVTGRAAGQFHFKDNPEKLAVLNALEDYGSGRSDTIDEARDFEAAWDKLEPTWVFSPGHDLVAYKAIRPQIEILRTNYSDAKTDWRSAVNKLTQMTGELSAVLVAWYDAATRAFGENTPEGVMLRGTIPTYYSGTDAAPVTPAVNPPTP